MTVATTVTKIRYAGNGATTAFPTTFKFENNSDLRVILINDTTQAEVVWAETTNYTVTGAGVSGGGTVTALVAPATGESLFIRLNTVFTQATDYQQNDAFPTNITEKAIDKVTQLAQINSEKASRAIKLKETTQKCRH